MIEAARQRRSGTDQTLDRYQTRERLRDVADDRVELRRRQLGAAQRFPGRVADLGNDQVGRHDWLVAREQFQRPIGPVFLSEPFESDAGVDH
jgi:hypothetical protein